MKKAERHKQYMKERYRSDPEFREKVKRVARESNRRRAAENRRIRDEAKSAGCSICGERDLRCLDFHHTRGKDRAVADAVSARFSEKRLRAEIAKCVDYCHKILA